MRKQKTRPLPARKIEDMRMHGVGQASQKAHIQSLKDLTARSPTRCRPLGLM